MSTSTEQQVPKWTRMEIWNHNGLQGRMTMAKAQIGAVLHAETPTPEAHILAAEIWDKLEELQTLLRARRDPY